MLSTSASPRERLAVFKVLRSRRAQSALHILSSQTTFLEMSFV